MFVCVCSDQCPISSHTLTRYSTQFSFDWRQYLQAGGRNEKNEREKETVAFYTMPDQSIFSINVIVLCIYPNIG